MVQCWYNVRFKDKVKTVTNSCLVFWNDALWELVKIARDDDLTSVVVRLENEAVTIIREQWGAAS